MNRNARCLFFLLLLLGATWLSGQDIAQPGQPALGPGGAEYLCDTVLQCDFADDAEGFWLYLPAEPFPASSPVVIFVHGYGAYNPMIYGKWIKHLVQKGNVVIFPRYQKNLIHPRPDHFASNVASAIRQAKIELSANSYISANWDQLVLVGHSYGGVISSDLATNFSHYGIPQPRAALLCSPGTGPLKGGRLENYAEMPSDLKLLVMVSENDRTVGDEFGQLVFNTANQVRQRLFIRQFQDDRGFPVLSAGHNEAYAPDLDFDSGDRNYSAKKALRVGKVDALDYYGYWKFLDALIACVKEGAYCDSTFSDSSFQGQLGNWSDGEAIKALEISIPQ